MSSIGCPYHIPSVHKSANNNNDKDNDIPKIVYLNDDSIVNDHPLSNIEYTKDDREYMRIMLNHFVEFLDTQRRLPVNKRSSPSSSSSSQTSYVVNINDQEKLRCIINNRDLALSLDQYCCVGFFGTRSNDNGKLDDIIESDKILVSLLPLMKGIVAYVTIQKDEPLNPSHLASPTTRDYGNIVIMESFDVINEWRNGGVHREAVEMLSPNYYHFVRIHNFCLMLPSKYESMQQYIEISPLTLPQSTTSRGDAIDLQIVRTKYYSFKDNKVNWRGLRTYGEITFTSFLSSNAYDSFKQIVEIIGRELNIKTKMVNIYELATPSEVAAHTHRELMDLYSIDYAFMCGASYSLYEPYFSLVATPIRSESRYDNKPVYYSDIIVNTDNTAINTIEDLVAENDILKSFTFFYNEKESFSGYQLFRHDFLYKYKESSSTSTPDTSSSSSSSDSSTHFDCYFKNCIKSKSHLESIKMVQNTPNSFATIDSTVLDTYHHQLQQNGNNNPKMDKYKVIGTLGPAPMPPLVATNSSIFMYHLESIKQFLTSPSFSSTLSSYTSSSNQPHNHYKSFEYVSPTTYKIFKSIKEQQ